MGNEVFEGFNDSDYKGNARSIFLKLIITLLIIGILGLVAFIVYNKFYSPQSIFKNTIVSLQDELHNTIDKIKTNGFRFETEISLNDKTDLFEDYSVIINNLSFKMSMGIDVDEEKIDGSLLFKYKNDDLGLIDYSFSNNGLIFDLNDIYDRPIKFNSEESNDNNTIVQDLDELDSYIGELLNSFKNSLDECDYKTEIVNLDGNKVRKYTLVINDNNYRDILNRIVDYLDDRKDFLNTLSKYLDEDISGLIVKEELNDLYDNVTISVYVSGVNNYVSQIEGYSGNEKIFSIKDLGNDKIKFSLNLGDMKIEETIMSENGKVYGIGKGYTDELSIQIAINELSVDEFKKNIINENNSINGDELDEDTVNSILQNLLERDSSKGLYEDLEDIITKYNNNLEDNRS